MGEHTSLESVRMKVVTSASARPATQIQASMVTLEIAYPALAARAIRMSTENAELLVLVLMRISSRIAMVHSRMHHIRVSTIAFMILG